jgi:L-asparaginase
VALRIIATGGTIASVSNPATGAVEAAVSGEALLQGLPLAGLGPVQVDDVTRVNGWNVSPATMLTVARRINEALGDEQIDGVVITHGTDTIEETLFLCDLLVGSDKPVAFAAAMRSGDDLGADGPGNLLSALQVAASKHCHGLGPVLVMNDEIHAARWVRKTDSGLRSAFTSPGHGPLGRMTPDGPRISIRPGRRLAVSPPASLDAAVPIVYAYTGIEEGLMESILDAVGARGLVVEGTGLGNLPGTAVSGVEVALGRGLPVVVASRVFQGSTATVYGGPGGGATLADLGVVGAGALSAAKARLLLMALLAGDQPADQAAVRFQQAVTEVFV